MIDTVVFDLGGVVIDWNPRHLYRQLIPDPVRMEAFLRDIVSRDWLLAQDAGRPWAEGIDLLVRRHPEWAAEIRAYRDRWEEMVIGEIPGTASLIDRLAAQPGLRLLALSNFAQDTFALTRARFPLLDRFEDILVSADHGLAKPDPAIFALFCRRYGVDSRRAVFFDDIEANVAAGQAAGFHAFKFESAAQATADLRALGLLD